MRRSVAVEWRWYRLARACRWFSPGFGRSRVDGTFEWETTEKSDDVGAPCWEADALLWLCVWLCRSLETRVKSDSDLPASEGATSEGGASVSYGVG